MIDDDDDDETFRKVLQHKASPHTLETRTRYQNSRLTLDACMSRQTGFNMEVSAPEHAG